MTNERTEQQITTDRAVLTKGLRNEAERFPKAKPAVEAVVASPKSLDTLASILRSV